MSDPQVYCILKRRSWVKFLLYAQSIFYTDWEVYLGVLSLTRSAPRDWWRKAFFWRMISDLRMLYLAQVVKRLTTWLDLHCKLSSTLLASRYCLLDSLIISIFAPAPLPKPHSVSTRRLAKFYYTSIKLSIYEAPSSPRAKAESLAMTLWSPSASSFPS